MLLCAWRKYPQSEKAITAQTQEDVDPMSDLETMLAGAPKLSVPKDTDSDTDSEYCPHRSRARQGGRNFSLFTPSHAGDSDLLLTELYCL
jgi:hypothetical protein